MVHEKKRSKGEQKWLDTLVTIRNLIAVSNKSKNKRLTQCKWKGEDFIVVAIGYILNFKGS
jgi:hypothetical protein